MATTKNRFSMLLEQLLNTADIKQYVLAKYLNYDTSYISKWLNGRMIPGEKGIDEVLRGIGECIRENGSEEGLKKIAGNYQLRSMDELSAAIYDQLVIEYNYVVSISQLTGDDVAPELVMFPEMSIADFLRRMKHPILRRVSNLRIVAAVDLMSLSKEYQLEFTNLRLENKESLREYPNVRYNLVIDLHEEAKGSVIERVMLVTNMMIKMAHITANIYSSDFASGKAIFAVRDEFAISGMLHGSDRAISVVMCEGERYTTDLYRVAREICTKDNLCFLRKDLIDMFSNKEYLHMILSPGQRWMIGQISEYLLPEEILDELLNQATDLEGRLDIEMLRSISRFLSGVRRSNPIQIMIHENALLEFTLKGFIDVIGHKRVLDYEQRRTVLEYLMDLLENSRMDMRLIHGLLPEQVDFLPIPTLLSSDTHTYLKVYNPNLEESRLFLVNRPELMSLYNRFYKEVWDYDNGTVIEDKTYIKNYISQLLINIEFLKFSQS